ncbi:AAA family ATPase [Paenibacillus illinoisensis]|uniref:AAA family ATPase n=1 Tax=Paenibacillus illinoisensis TaxID=59845 RepID=UPI003D27507B
MLHISNFKLSSVISSNPNIYPDHVFRHMAGEVLLFDRITVLYGSNGSGKSTLLNLIANKLGMAGAERMSTYGHSIYVRRFIEESSYQLGQDEQERPLYKLPEGSRYIKSEDLLYEIKKIQQESVLREGLLHEQIVQGKSKGEVEELEQSYAFEKRIDIIRFSQEKYSNGESSMQFFEEHLLPGQLYLLDEPETSLSPANQINLAEQMNDLARYFDSQFIIATHSPFVLGTLHAKIYNLDASMLQTAEWYELDNVRFFYEFFHKHQRLFE